MLRAQLRITAAGRRSCITDIVSNYEKISFNFGPTLLLWMEQQAPELHAAIEKADARSVGAAVRTRQCHGSGL